MGTRFQHAAHNFARTRFRKFCHKVNFFRFRDGRQHFGNMLDQPSSITVEEINAKKEALLAGWNRYVATLTTEQLDQPHTGAVSIAGIVQRRDAVIHHLRHENLHTGQLAWLCKLNGVKTV